MDTGLDMNAGWTFNSLLFSSLTDVLGISGAEIARRCGLTQQVLNRYMNNEIVLSVQVLMKVCNALRIPSRHFVTRGRHVIPDREAATLPPHAWQPVTWDGQAVELTFGDGEGRIFWKDVAAAMGVSPQKPHDRFLLRTRFPVDGFLTACSRLGLSPFTFLVDPNTPGAAEKRRREDGELAAEIRSMGRRIDDLGRTVDVLTRRYEELLLRHESLERKVMEITGEGV